MLANSYQKLIRFSMRIIARNKFYSLIILLSFALGIGTCTVAYSLFESILNSPLPFHEAEQLVLIKSRKDGSEGSISLSDIQSLKERMTGFTDIAAYWPGVQYNLSGDEGKLPEEVPTTLCTSNLFAVLGVDMQLGQVWPESFDQNKAFGTVITHSLWARRYDSNPDKVGTGLNLDTNGQYGMYGVLPEGFSFPFEAEVFRSMIIAESQLTNRNFRNVTGVARLAAGYSMAQAQADLAAAGLAMEAEFDANEGLSFELNPLPDMYLGNIAPYLKLIAIAVALVFLLVCVNVGSLLLSIAHQRNKEIAIRRLVGGKLRTILGQYLAQNLILALAGGFLGFLLSHLALQVIGESIAQELPFWVSLELNNQVMLMALGLTLFAGVITALLPALKSARIGGKFLVSPSKGSLGFDQRVKDLLVGIQMTLGSGLVILATMIIQDLVRLQQTELGFEPEDLQVFEVAIPFDKYKYDFDAVNAFYKNALESFQRIPGIESAGLIDHLPLAEAEEIVNKSQVSLEGQSAEDMQLNPQVIQQKVSPAYHAMMGIGLQAGRYFSETDLKESQAVCLLSEDLANRLYPGKNAMGQRLKVGGPNSNNALMTIVGIVQNVKHEGLSNTRSYDLYVPMVQTVAYDAFFMAKTQLQGQAFHDAITSIMEQVDPDQSVFGFTPMTDIVNSRLWKQRISGSIFSVFGIIAFAIALIGVYAVVNHSVNAQLKQLSVRRVLGANRAQITRLMLAKIFILSIGGMGLALLAISSLSQPLSGLIMEVSLSQHLGMGWYLLAFLLTALLAGLVPVRRMLRINPARVLRAE